MDLFYTLVLAGPSESRTTGSEGGAKAGETAAANMDAEQGRGLRAAGKGLPVTPCLCGPVSPAVPGADIPS